MSLGLKNPEGESPLGVDQNLIDPSLPLLVRGVNFLSSPDLHALKRAISHPKTRTAQVLGIFVVAGISTLAAMHVSGGDNARAEGSKVAPTPTPKPEYNLKGGMPSQKLVQTRAPEDTYGSEVTREKLEQMNLKITARDYVLNADGSGNVIQQWVVLDNHTLYRSSENLVQGKWPDFIPVYRWPDNITITSLASSSNGSPSVAAGVEGHPALGNAKIFFTADNSRTSWIDLAVPPGLTGSPSELIRLDDKNYWGSILESEGIVHQFIVKVDSTATNAAIIPANIETVVPVSTSVGMLQNTRIASLDAPNQTATIISNRYLQDGIVVSRLNYGTAIGTANIITQTKLTDGTIINLGYTYGTGIYTYTLGNPRVSISNFIRNTLYDFNLTNPLDGTATEFYYANRCDNKGIPNYGPGTLSILALDISVDAQGNKKTKFGGSRSSTVDGFGRAIFGFIEDGTCLDLEPYKQSGIMRQQDMQNMKISNENGTELGIRGLGKAFVDGNLNVYFTDRGLGTSLPEPPVYRLYLSSVVSGSTVISSSN